jgi:hypothetical protein
LFSQADFIEASRKFVCIRIETYENKEAEEKVRALLNGRYANTAFCMFNPNGTERLSRSGRSPFDAFGRKSDGDDKELIGQMNQIAAKYTPSGETDNSVLQDFNSFRQALNVASADQRLLVFVDVEKDDQKKVRNNLETVFADQDIVGKFHLNFMDKEVDQQWSKSIKGNTRSPGIFIIRSGTFGIDGVVMDHLSPTTAEEEIKAAMVGANEKFASIEERKTYSEHVRAGKRQRIHFENEIPQVEDRNGDGQTDGKRRGGKPNGQRRRGSRRK